VNRRILTLLAALVPVLVLGIVGSAVTVPFVALGPGPTFNTLGAVDGKQVVDVRGEPVHPTSGNLNMTTVSVRDGLNIFEAFGLWADGNYGLAPRAEIYPPGVPRDEVDKSNQEDFKNSEDDAELAALHYLKYPTVVRLTDVGAHGPATGLLDKGDQVVSVAGKPVATSAGLEIAVKATKPGTVVPIVVRRGGVQQTVEVKLGARPDGPSEGYLGVTPTEIAQGPLEVDFNLANIGGPSAGLMFSLSLVDKLSTGKLNDGKFIAGTGTIDPDGKVGPIGGIQYKMIAARAAGAQTFLVPADNCNEARQRIPQGLSLIKVDTLTTAIDALNELTAGKPTPTCG
jgi:PDZ domain-containing protein